MMPMPYYYIERLLPLAVLGAAGIGVLMFQVWLCRRKCSLYGMILPILTLLFMLDRAHVPLHDLWGQTLRVRLVVCAPTIALLLVYWLCRGAGRRKAELRRMNIQDLG